MRPWTILFIILLASGCSSRGMTRLDSDDPDERREGLTELSATSLEGPDVAQRARAAVREEVVEGLRKALRADDDRDVRLVAARELGRLRANDAVPDLIQAMRDETPDVRYHAQRSLVKVTGIDKGPTYDDWANWKREGGG